MKRNLAVLSLIAVCAVVSADELVVPNNYASTTGTGTFLGPFSNAQRTYQLLIHSSQLTDFVGKQLNGLTWRLPASASNPWPATALTYANFDIYLSGSVDPSARSLTFADNVVGTQTQVRSGSLSVDTGYLTNGSSPNAFGAMIGFTPWTYSGGNLLIELRHSTSNGASTSVDALTTSTAGYGTLFSAAWTGSYTGTSGSQGNFAVTKLSAAPVPEPATILALGAGLALIARRRRR